MVPIAATVHRWRKVVDGVSIGWTAMPCMLSNLMGVVEVAIIQAMQNVSSRY